MTRREILMMRDAMRNAALAAYTRDAQAQHICAVVSLADGCREVNPSFDAARFRAECGVFECDEGDPRRVLQMSSVWYHMADRESFRVN